MGVSGFNKFFSKINKQFNIITNIVNVSQNLLFIDLSCMLYRNCIGRRNTRTCIWNRSNRDITHIYVLFKFVHKALMYGYHPVFIFDGDSNECKKYTISKRHKRGNSCILTKEKINECKQLLNHLGIPYITSIGESDQQCAAMANYYDTRTAGVVSDDTDILVYGGNKLLKNFSFSSKKTDVIDRNDLLNYLTDKTNKIRKQYGLKLIEEFTHHNFIDFSIMMGTDYRGDNNFNFRIPTLSHDKLFELFVINDLDVIKLINFVKPLINLSNSYTEQLINTWTKIKDLYQNSIVINPKYIDIDLQDINFNDLCDFLENNIEINMNVIKNELRSLYYYNKITFHSYRSYNSL